jgi:hypothetical protein
VKLALGPPTPPTEAQVLRLTKYLTQRCLVREQLPAIGSTSLPVPGKRDLTVSCRPDYLSVPGDEVGGQTDQNRILYFELPTSGLQRPDRSP